MPGMCACVEQELGNSPWFAGVHLMCLRHAPLQPHSRPRKIKKRTHTQGASAYNVLRLCALCMRFLFTSLSVAVARKHDWMVCGRAIVDIDEKYIGYG